MRKKGSILMISLWVLLILVVFAVGLGHRASISLRLGRYQRDRLKAAYLAKAGINLATIELEKDRAVNNYDSLNETWSTGLDSNNKHILENIEINPDYSGTVTVKYLYDKEKDEYLCMLDEERKININTAQASLLISLLIEKTGVQQIDTALQIANLIRTYRGDTGLEEIPSFKRGAFRSPEELLIVLQYFYQKQGLSDYKRQAQEIYLAIKDLITVYPTDTVAGVKFNINTVSEEVLNILAKAVAQTIEEKNCVSTVTSGIISARNEKIENNPYQTPFPGDITIAFNSPCNAFFDKLKNENFVFASNYFTIPSLGNVGQTNKAITAVYDRNNRKIISWHEN